MNIDVTVMGLSEQWRNGAINGSNIRTWSEKFEDVDVEERDGKLSINAIPRGTTEEAVDTFRKTYFPNRIASFAPGAWHSWRQVKD